MELELPVDQTIKNLLDSKLNAIEDFGKDQKLSHLIRTYNRLILDYINKRGSIYFVHTRKYL